MPVGTNADQPWLIELDKVEALAGDNRVAYLRTKVWSPKEQKARLELGSDDGVKVWLNGQLVHANNAVRPVRAGTGQGRRDAQRRRQPDAGEADAGCRPVGHVPCVFARPTAASSKA